MSSPKTTNLRHSTTFSKAIQCDSKCGAAYGSRGHIYFRLNQFDSALSDFNVAIFLNRNNGDLYHRRALIYDRLGRFDETLADLNQAICLDPANADALFRRGKLQCNKGSYEIAIADLTKACQLDSSDKKAHGWLAYALINSPKSGLRDLERAVRSARSACELSDWKDLSSLRLLARAHFAAGHYLQAAWLGRVVLEPTLAEVARIVYRTMVDDVEPKFVVPEGTTRLANGVIMGSARR